MFGNGAAIGMGTIITVKVLKVIRKDPAAAKAVFCAAVPGATIPATAELPTAPGTTQALRTTITGFV